MVGHVLLFHPAIQKIKDLISSGKIGNLQYIYSNRLNLGEVRNEENVFWSFAPHDISVLQYLIEEFPIKTRCGSERIHFGITDSTWSFNKFNGISLQEIETVKITHENYSEKFFFDRKDEWIKVDIDH